MRSSCPAVLFETGWPKDRMGVHSPSGGKKMKRTMLLAVATLMLAGGALAQMSTQPAQPAQPAHNKPTPPAQNVSHKKHPNIAAAQRMCHNAYEKIVAA